MKAVTLIATGVFVITIAIAALLPLAGLPGLSLGMFAQPEAEPAISDATYIPTEDETHLDPPQTEGTWHYENEPAESLAVFGLTTSEAVFIIRCAGGEMALGRVTGAPQSEPRAMSIVTETTTGQLEANPVPSRPQILAAPLPADSALLDAMAITKGRFAVEMEGETTLYLPAWVEVSRVIEDCR